MALLIPESCPSKATAGERRVFALLRDTLPNDFLAWYEPVVGRRYPDFTLLAAGFGLLMIEVKGWYAGQIERATNAEVELSRRIGDQVKIEVHEHPKIQARDYVLRLVDELTRPEHSILHHPDGGYRERLCIPFGFGVVLTNITRRQLAEAGLDAVFDAGTTICRDEIESMATAGPDALIGRLRGFFPAYFGFDPLTEDQVRTIRGVLHREVVVRRRPATADSVPNGWPLPSGATVLDVLDAEQERAAHNFSLGHHVVFGVAGSGKTTLILARARLIALRDPAKRVLILCFKRVLAAYLAGQLGDDPALRRVEASSFDSWLSRRSGLQKDSNETWEDFRDRMIAAIASGEASRDDRTHYDTILIDEAHDFEPDWLRCVTGLLMGGPYGDLLIAMDGAQGLYARHKGLPGSRSACEPWAVRGSLIGPTGIPNRFWSSPGRWLNRTWLRKRPRATSASYLARPLGRGQFPHIEAASRKPRSDRSSPAYSTDFGLRRSLTARSPSSIPGASGAEWASRVGSRLSITQ